MNKRYIVDLTADERANLLALLGKGVAPTRKLARARILLLADEGMTDKEIAAALHVHRVTVERARRRFVEGGIEHALNEQPRPGGRPKLDGKQEAMLVALACSQAPEGRGRWTLQLLAWSNSTSSIPSATRRCGARSKKRAETMAEEAVVHRHCGRGFRLAHGGRA